MLHDLSAIEMHHSSLGDLEVYLRDRLNQHQQTRANRIDNLLAADSFMSEKTRAYLADPIAGHSAAGNIGRHNRWFAGCRYIDDIDSLCHLLCREIFQANYCEHRVLGGTQANMIVYVSLLNPGDRICTVSPQCGGDSSSYHQSILSKLNVIIDDIPFTQNLTIDYERLEQMFKQNRYRLLTLGFSVSLIQQDLPRLIELCRRYQIICHVDCAHELAFIASGLLANPLRLGADVMTASTGKAFAGPPGGLILWHQQKFSEPIITHTFPYSVGGYQNNRVLALTQTLIEYKLQQKQYLEQALTLSEPFANALESHDVKIGRYNGIASHTHHLIIDCEQQNPRQMMYKIESRGILTSLATLPLSNRLGLRLSTIQPAIRFYQTNDINQLAFRISKAIRSKTIGLMPDN